jgi:hypothetical protein
MSGSIAAGSLVEYGYTSEVVFGSTPTGRAFKKVRDVGFSLNLQKEIYQSEERKTDRMRQDARHGYRSVAGEVNGDISEQSWDDFLEAVIGGTWANITPVSTTLDISIDSTANKITSLTSSFDFLTSGITVGDVFFVVTNPGPVSGFSGEYLTVLSATASTIEVEPNTITTTAASVSVARIYEVGRKVSIGNTYRSFTFERWLTDRNLYQQFRGVRINQVTFSIPASGLASLTFGVLGQDATIFSSTTVASVYSETPQTTPFAVVNGALFEGGQVLGLVTAAEITLNNNMASSQVVGSNIVPDILFGRYADVTGTITVLFSDASALNKFVDQVESSLVIRLQNKDVLDQDTQFINLVLPRIKYSGGDIDDGVEGGVTLTLPFIALAPLSINPAQGSTSLFIQASNVVPRTELFNFLSGVPSGWTYSRASNATYFSSTGVLTVASANVARVDYDPSGLAVRGLLCEPSRVNEIRNNTMGGAVAGTPGTNPDTGWSSTGAGGNVTSRQIVAIGTDDGINYIEYRYITSGAAIIDISLMGGYTATASTGEQWVASSFAKLQAGSLTNVTSMALTLGDSGGSSSSLFTPTNAALRTQRYSHSRILTSATITTFIFRTTTNGAADFTLRIGLPQLELGSFATSPIRTSGAAVTRAADRLIYGLATNAPWFQSSSGYTYSLDFISPSNSQGGAVYLGAAAGSFSNTSYLTTGFNYIVNTSGQSGSLPFNTALQANKVAVSINYSGARFGFNNDTRLVSNQGYPLMTTFAVLSAPWGVGNFAAGWARSATFSNYYYSDAELKALVT